jgi:Lar family restriction alleviation protein
MADQITTELLPCPFCGGAPTVADYRDHEDQTGESYGYAAVECNCLGPHGGLFFHFDTKAEAIAAWNRRAAARVTPEPVARWTPIKQTPEAGGTYVVGGYVDDGALRTFRRCFARLVRTLNGPEWSYCDPEKDSVIPMSFWCDLPPHPEHAAPASPSIASPGREEVLWRALDALESTEALDNRENCPECEGEGEPEICPVCFPAADDARIKRRNAIAAIRALTGKGGE